MKSKRKCAGQVFCHRSRSKRHKNYKIRSSNQKNVLQSLDKQLKYNKAKLGKQMKLLRQNKAMLLKYMKPLRAASKRLYPEQFREYFSNAKLEILFLKLHEMEKHLKMYRTQLTKAIEEYKNVKYSNLTANLMSIENSSVENSEDSGEVAACCSPTQNGDKSPSLSSSMTMRNDLKSKKLLHKRLKSLNSFKNLIMESKTKGKMEDQKLPNINETNETDPRRIVSGQEPVIGLTRYKRCFGGALTKSKRRIARRRLKLRKNKKNYFEKDISINQNKKEFAVKEGNSKQKEGLSHRPTTIRKDTNDTFQPQKTKSMYLLNISKDEYTEKNIYNKYMKLHKSGKRKRKKKPAAVKGRRSKLLRWLSKQLASERAANPSVSSLTSEKSYSKMSNYMSSVGCQKTSAISETMECAASRIIDALFKESVIESRKDKRAKNAVHRLFANRFTPHYERSPLSQVDDIYYDLLHRKNEWQAYVRDIEGSESVIKSYLNESYMQNLRMVLHNQIYQITQQITPDETFGGKKAKELTNPMPLRWSSFSWNAWKISINFIVNSALKMHRRFFSNQMKMLHKIFLKTDIKNLNELIMGREWPVGQDDRELLNEYDLDQQRHNILILALEPSSNQRQCEEKNRLLVDNFNFIKHLKENEIRHITILESTSFASCQLSDFVDEGILCQGEFDLNNSYVAEQRSKWAKYFALKEKTPMELYLDEQKNKQKIHANPKRRQGARKNLQNSRSLSALYTAPRLTHRMQKALNEMAKEERHVIKHKKEY